MHIHICANLGTNAHSLYNSTILLKTSGSAFGMLDPFMDQGDLVDQGDQMKTNKHFQFFNKIKELPKLCAFKPKFKHFIHSRSWTAEQYWTRLWIFDLILEENHYESASLCLFCKQAAVVVNVQFIQIQQIHLQLTQHID